MPLQIRFSIFIKEAILFGLTLGLGLYSAYYYNFYSQSLINETGLNFTVTDLVVLVILILALILATRYKKIYNFSFKFFLLLIVFLGSQVVFGTFISSPWDLFAALLFTLMFSRGWNVLFHNLGIIFGIAGVAAVFGLSISTQLGLIFLIALSIYDILAVYVTKHMVTLAKNMVESGAIFGFLVPFEFEGFLYNKLQAKAKVGENFMILGSGDIGLPLIFVSTLVKISLMSAILTSIFSILGLFITHLIFMNQTNRKPMAALPPIATMTIIGYLISLLI